MPLIFLFLLIFSIPAFAGQPNWFGVLPSGTNELIGYGTGTSEEAAVSQAKKEIAASIETRICSKDKIETNVNNKNIDERADFFVQSETDVVLNDVAVLKKEKKGKIWYVGVKSDTRPVEAKLTAGLSAYECHNERQNLYLTLTPIFKSINAELKCSFDIRLVRNNKLWYLTYKNMNVCLNNEAFQKLIVSFTSSDVSIFSSKTLLHEGDGFSLDVRADQFGYITIVNACQDGEVFLLDTNHLVNINTHFSFPDKKSDKVLEAALLSPNESTHDLYIAILTKEPFNPSRFHFAGAQVEKREWDFKFDELLTILDEQKFGAVLIRTEPK
jgi:hypothetical protein